MNTSHWRKKRIVILGYNINNTDFYEQLSALDLQVDITQDVNILLNPIYDAYIIYGLRTIIPEYLLNNCQSPIINMHISLLPWNRGAHPNFWSHYEESPSGVSLHLVDSGIDTGPLIAQEQMFIDIHAHTFESSYLMLKNDMERLMLKYIIAITHNNFKSYPQKSGGSLHFKRDLPTLFGGWDKNIFKEITRLKSVIMKNK